MSGSVQAAEDKMAVMLGRNPLNSESFFEGLRQKHYGVQHGAFGRDSINDFALRGC